MKRSVVVLLALPFIVATQSTSTEAAEGGGAILRTECLPNDTIGRAEQAAQTGRPSSDEADHSRDAARAAAEKAAAANVSAARTIEELELERALRQMPGRDEGVTIAPPSQEPPSAMDRLLLKDPASLRAFEDEQRRRAEEQAQMTAATAQAEGESQRRAEEESRAASEAPAHPALEASVALEDLPHAQPTPLRASDGQDAAWDWGASLFLSNDDSMSLASAQRVLYALNRGVGLDAGDVRPHELLNYFSFDTVDPRRNDTFALTAAAEAHGDTLSMAMAVQGAEPKRRPLDLTAVVDVSGSMEGDGRLDTVQRALHLVEGQLEEGDRVDVVTFSDHQCVALEDFVVGRDDPSLLQRAIDGMAPAGGTNLSAGLTAGYDLAEARTTRGRNQRVMLMTDAHLNRGVTDHDIVAGVARAYEDQGIRLTGVGVGRDFHDAFLDKLTDRGKGAYVYLGSDAVVDRLFGVGFPALVETVAHDVQFELELPDSLAMERFYGEEVSTVAADVQPVHYYAGTSQLFLQDLHMGDVARRDRVRLTVRYTDAATGEPDQQAFETTVGALLDADPRNVRKARALMAFSDVVLDQAMGEDPCPSMATYSQRASQLSDDAEIGYVNGLLGGVCPGLSAPVAYKLSFQTDRPLAQASLDCGGELQGQALSASDTVAAFLAQPGTCQLLVNDGSDQWTASVAVPSTGGGARCVVRGRRLSCR